MLASDVVILQERIAGGDERAYEQLYYGCAPNLLRFANTLIKDAMMAEEAVEDVFVAIWQQRTSLVEKKDLMVYLYVAVKNRCLTALRSRSRDLAVYDGDMAPQSSVSHHTPESMLMTKEMAARIAAVVASLPPRCQMVFNLVRSHGLRYREVAAILEISEHTVDAQMTLATKKISSAIKLIINS